MKKKFEKKKGNDRRARRKTAAVEKNLAPSEGIQNPFQRIT